MPVSGASDGRTTAAAVAPSAVRGTGAGSTTPGRAKGACPGRLGGGTVRTGGGGRLALRSGQGGSGVLAQPPSKALASAMAASGDGIFTPAARCRVLVWGIEFERSRWKGLMRGPRCPGAATWGRGWAAYYPRSRGAAAGARSHVCPVACPAVRARPGIALMDKAPAAINSIAAGACWMCLGCNFLQICSRRTCRARGWARLQRVQRLKPRGPPRRRPRSAMLSMLVRMGSGWPEPPMPRRA